VRYLWALLFALMLSLRLVGSAGYMPTIDHGSVAIVACPDAELNAPLALPAMHHHGHMQHAHSICPYAAAAALGAADVGFVAFAAILLVGIALQIGRAFASLAAQRNRERPPAIGPPLRA